VKSILVIINVDRGPHFEIERGNYHSSDGGQPVGFVGSWSAFIRSAV